MAYVLALLSAGFYGAADFTGGIATRRAAAIPVVLLSQACGLVMVALALPLLPRAAPTNADLWWGAAAGLFGGFGVALLYRALAMGTMSVVAPITAVTAVTLPVVTSIALGERPGWIPVMGIALGIASIVLISRQTAHPPLSPSAHRSGIRPALLAVRIGPLSAVVTLSSLYPASTVLLARAVLGERLSVWQTTGVVTALVAVGLIVSG